MNITEYEASLSDICIVDNIRKLYYPQDVLVPTELYYLVISRQINSTFILCADKNVIGYYSIIYLEKKVYELMVKHIISERDLAKLDYIPLIDNTSAIEGMYIYILSIAAADINNSAANLALLYSLKKKVNHTIANYNAAGVFADFFNLKIKKILKNNNYVENISY